MAGDKIKKAAYNKNYKKAQATKGIRSSTLWKRANPEKAKFQARRSDLRIKYGMTLEDYESFFNLQNGVCAICFQPQLNKMLAVDHCHITFKVRGLLCMKCNTNLGVYENMKEKFEEYLNGTP